MDDIVTDQTQTQAQPPTEYVILKLTPEGTWERVNTQEAHSTSAAVKATVSRLADADQSGTFVAVPARSFQPVKVTPRVQTTLDLEQA